MAPAKRGPKPGRPKKLYPGETTTGAAMAGSIHDIEARLAAESEREAGLSGPRDGAPPEAQSDRDPRRLKGKVVLGAVAAGLSEDDALVLAEWPRAEFDAYKLENPRFAQVLARKEVEYKQSLLKPINQAVKEGDAKMAQWLLEKKHSEEYGKKKPTAPEERGNPIAEIVRQIQAGGAAALLPGGRVRATLREATVEFGEAAAPIAQHDLRDPLEADPDPVAPPGVRLPVTISDEG